MSHVHQSHQPEPNVDEVALIEGNLWAEKMMSEIPPGRTWTMITRKEYHEMLVLAFAMGFKQGRKPPN